MDDVTGHILRDFSDDGLALAFAERHEMTLRFVSDWNRWMIWDGVTWGRDEQMLVVDYARTLARDASESAARTMKAKLCSTRTIYAIVSLARSDRRLAAVVDQWDGDAMRLSCDGEIYRLDDDSFPRLTFPGDYVTKSTAIKPCFDEGACPMWLSF